MQKNFRKLKIKLPTNRMIIQKYFPHLIVLEKIGFLWPLPQRKFPKVPKKFQTFYRWYRLIYRCFISFALYFCLFCAFYVLFKTPGKTLLISGEVTTYATFLLYAISLQYQEIDDSERSGFLGRLFLMDMEFDGKKLKFGRDRFV